MLIWQSAICHNEYFFSYTEHDKEMAFKKKVLLKGLNHLLASAQEAAGNEFLEALLSSCDLYIQNVIKPSITSCQQNVHFRFIYKSENTEDPYLFIKDNWHKAWSEPFPVLCDYYSSKDIENAKLYAEANCQNTVTLSQEEVSSKKFACEIIAEHSEQSFVVQEIFKQLLEPSNPSEILIKRELRDKYLKDNCQRQFFDNLLRETEPEIINDDDFRVIKRIRFICFDGNYTVEGQPGLFTDHLREQTLEYKYPCYEVGFSKGNKLKLVAATF